MPLGTTRPGWVVRLWHLGSEKEDGEDEPLLLGVFSSEEKALAWQRDAVELPGFRDWPDRFELSPYTVDEREWTTGFETVPPATEADRRGGRPPD